MNRNRSLLKIGNQEVIVEGHYMAYYNDNHVAVCVGLGNKVVSVENLSQATEVSVGMDGKGTIFVLGPRTKVSFGTLSFSKDDLKFSYRDTKPQIIDSEDEYESEYDAVGDCYD